MRNIFHAIHLHGHERVPKEERSILHYLIVFKNLTKFYGTTRQINLGKKEQFYF